MLHDACGAIASLAVLVVVFVPLERVFPARAGQPVLRPAFAVDLCFFFGQYLLLSGLSIGLLTRARSALLAVVPERARAVASEQPLRAQAIAVIVLGDLLVYWFHRACHSFDLLWRFHAVHHGARHLDWLAAHREHPLDGIGTQLCQNLPAIAVGFPIHWLAGLVVFRSVWAIFIHANARVPLGPLRFLLGAPELHHWHHARLPRTRHNFANLAPWLDVLFGTYHRPGPEETYPLGLTEPWPRGYVAQLLRPFTGLVRSSPRPRRARGAA